MTRPTRHFKRRRKKRSKKNPVERQLPCNGCPHFRGGWLSRPKDRGAKGCALGNAQTEPVWWGWRFIPGAGYGRGPYVRYPQAKVCKDRSERGTYVLRLHQ